MSSMQKVLIVFATNSGSTYVAGEIIKQILSKDFSVTMQNVSEINLPDPENYEVIIFGSPSWDFDGKEGMPHQMIIKLFSKWQNKSFINKKIAIYGCGDKMFAFFCGAVDHMEKFVASVGGQLVVPSLRLDSFFFELEENTELAKKWANNLLKKLKS